MSEDKKPEISTLSFEQAMTELESLVRRLEGGEIDLEESIDAYERGMALKRHCQEKLDQAKARIDKITVGPDGNVGTEPAEFN
ncbi:MAG: exodeoxyribonuclease VII small subunit [Alphaproteobacteria bacterium]